MEMYVRRCVPELTTNKQTPVYYGPDGGLDPSSPFSVLTCYPPETKPHNHKVVDLVQKSRGCLDAPVLTAHAVDVNHSALVVAVVGTFT